MRPRVSGLVVFVLSRRSVCFVSFFVRGTACGDSIHAGRLNLRRCYPNPKRGSSHIGPPHCHPQRWSQRAWIPNPCSHHAAWEHKLRLTTAGTSPDGPFSHTAKAWVRVSAHFGAWRAQAEVAGHRGALSMRARVKTRYLIRNASSCRYTPVVQR